MTNFETISAINTALANHQFTITQASDWTMLLVMASMLFAVFIGAWGIVVKLLIYGFKDIKEKISAQREENDKRYTDCKSAIWDHIEGPIWTAIKEHCSSWSKADQESLKDGIKRCAEGGA
jgi:hypothetical protein